MRKVIFSVITQCLLFTFFYPLYGQVAINTDGSIADPSAALDIKSTTQGILIPRLTTVQRENISNAISGLLVFDSDTNTFWFYNGEEWDEQLSTPFPDPVLSDNDGDTKVVLDQSPDDDMIHFTLGNMNRMRWGVNASGRPMWEFLNNNGLTSIGLGASSQNLSTAFGYLAGSDVGNGGPNNAYFGDAAGLANQGQENLFFGSNTGNLSSGLGTANTLIGVEAGQKFSDNDFNTAIGYQSGLQIDGGNYNVLLNSSLNTSEIDGFLNIGDVLISHNNFFATFGFLNLAENLQIGSGKISPEGNSVSTGFRILENGNIGLDRTDPSKKLDVQADMKVSGEFTFDNNYYPIGSDQSLTIVAGKFDEDGNLITTSTTSSFTSGAQQEITGVTKNGTGDYTINIDGSVFDKRPAVMLTCHHTNGNVNRYASIVNITTTAVRIRTRNHNGNANNAIVSFMLVGKRPSTN